MGAETLDFDQLDKLYPNSYLRFSHQPAIWEVDAALIKMGQLLPGQRVALLGVGYGADIEHLEDQGKLDNTTVYAVDLDPKALSYVKDRFGGQTRFNLQALEENMEATSVEDGSVDEAEAANSGHNAAAWRNVFREAGRIVRLGGDFLVSSAYMKGHAYPTRKDHLVWGKITRGGTENALAIPEYRGIQIPPSEELVKLSTNEFLTEAMIEEFGFEVVEVKPYMVRMDRDCMKAICYYEWFADGAIPAPEIPIDIRANALVQAVDPVYDELGITAVDREWMLFKFRKRK